MDVVARYGLVPAASQPAANEQPPSKRVELTKLVGLTKLVAAPTLAPQAALRPEVPPCAHVGGSDAGAASQPVPVVGRTCEVEGSGS